ncbi:hypothetical protein SLEP1_g24910 [Rubroshorea leprosula]|uniref:Uncharacterized protein n=1 Tax=Rubroshorea leprosula TaxID=152421 RepID=A0AAV5JMH6_9ROSI|nr:hypothetical protein SLEP1_g24910 [Rubroshorea leprosula]
MPSKGYISHLVHCSSPLVYYPYCTSASTCSSKEISFSQDLKKVAYQENHPHTAFTMILQLTIQVH